MRDWPPSSYLISYPTTPLDEVPPCVTLRNENAYFPQFSGSDRHSMLPSNIVSIPSLQPLIDEVETEIEPIFTVNIPKSKSADSNQDRVVAFTELPVYKSSTGAIGRSGRPPLRNMNTQFLLQHPVQTGNIHGLPTAESSILAKALSIECAAISPDPNDAKEYIEPEIVSDDSGVPRNLDRPSMAGHQSKDFQIVSRPNFFENFIFPAVARRAEMTPNPNLHLFKASRHRVIPSKVSDLTMARVPNATIVAPSGSDLASFSRPLPHAPNEANITPGTAPHVLALTDHRPSVFQTHSSLVPPRKVQATSPLRRRKRKILVDPTIKIKDQYARRMPQSLLTPTPIVRPSLATRGAMSPSLRSLIRSSTTASIKPTALVYSGPNVTLPSRDFMLDSHSAVTNIPHLSAQVDVMPQDVELHTSSPPAPVTCTSTTPASAQPIPIPQRNSIETDHAEMSSANMTTWETFLSQPQTLPKDRSKSPKVVDQRGQRGNPSIFRQSSKLQRNAQMSRPVLLGTPLVVPEGASVEGVTPDQSSIPHQRDAQVGSIGQEISITMPLKYSRAPLPAATKQIPHLHSIENNETKVGSLKLPHNRHLDMSASIVTQPSSQKEVDRVDILDLDHPGGGSDVFAAGTEYPLFVPRDLRSRVIFQPLVSPPPAIPIILSDSKPDSQPSTERIVLGPISAWSRAIPHRLNLAKAPLPGIHTILSLPDQRL